MTNPDAPASHVVAVYEAAMELDLAHQRMRQAMHLYSGEWQASRYALDRALLKFDRACAAARRAEDADAR
mgnify:CR=1 FL=1